MISHRTLSLLTGRSPVPAGLLGGGGVGRRGEVPHRSPCFCPSGGKTQTKNNKRTQGRKKNDSSAALRSDHRRDRGGRGEAALPPPPRCSQHPHGLLSSLIASGAPGAHGAALCHAPGRGAAAGHGQGGKRKSDPKDANLFFLSFFFPVPYLTFMLQLCHPTVLQPKKPNPRQRQSPARIQQPPRLDLS